MFDDVLTFAEASAASVGLTASNIRYGFETVLGASATAGFDLDEILFIDVPRLAFANVGYEIETEANGTGFTSASDSAAQPITGFGVPTTPLLSLQAEVTLDGSQQSTLRIDDLVGVVRAEYESGAFVTDTFSIRNDATSSLDLALSGDWELELVGVAFANSFDTSLGLAASVRAGVAIGDCGDDFTTSDDNPFIGCVFETGTSATSPQLTLINPAPFGLDFGTQTVALGNITVGVAPVPLPAGMSLMLAGLGVFGLARRRKMKAAA